MAERSAEMLLGEVPLAAGGGADRRHPLEESGSEAEQYDAGRVHVLPQEWVQARGPVPLADHSQRLDRRRDQVPGAVTVPPTWPGEIFCEPVEGGENLGRPVESRPGSVGT